MGVEYRFSKIQISFADIDKQRTGKPGVRNADKFGLFFKRFSELGPESWSEEAVDLSSILGAIILAFIYLGIEGMVGEVGGKGLMSTVFKIYFSDSENAKRSILARAI